MKQLAIRGFLAFGVGMLMAPFIPQNITGLLIMSVVGIAIGAFPVKGSR